MLGCPVDQTPLPNTTIPKLLNDRLPKLKMREDDRVAIHDMLCYKALDLSGLCMGNSLSLSKY